MAIELIAKVKPKNGSSFALVDAVDVEMPDGTRLSDRPRLLPVTQDEYDALVKAGTVQTDVLYMIVRDGE